MGFFSRKSDELVDTEAIQSSVFMTIIQALDAAKSSPAADFVPQYSKLLSAIISKNYNDGLMKQATFQILKYSPFNIEINEDDYKLFPLVEADGAAYLARGLAISQVLGEWAKSKNVTNENQKEIFSDLIDVCAQHGMNRNDEESVGLLFVVSIYFTTLLKDSQINKGDRESLRSTGLFFATELPNRWIIELSKR